MDSIREEELIKGAMKYCLSQLPGATEIMKIKEENETLKKANDNLCKTINDLKEENDKLNKAWAIKRDENGDEYRKTINELKMEISVLWDIINRNK